MIDVPQDDRFFASDNNQLSATPRSSQNQHPATGDDNAWQCNVELGLEMDEVLLSPEELRRLNEGPDASFYTTPCFSQHVDDCFLSRLTGAFLHQGVPDTRSQKSVHSASSLPVLDLCTV